MPAPAQPGDEIIPFVHQDGRPGVTILFAGRANEPPGVDVADLGVSVRSVTTGEILDQSVQRNVFNGWRVRTAAIRAFAASVPEVPFVEGRRRE